MLKWKRDYDGEYRAEWNEGVFGIERATAYADSGPWHAGYFTDDHEMRSIGFYRTLREAKHACEDLACPALPLPFVPLKIHNG